MLESASRGGLPGPRGVCLVPGGVCLVPGGSAWSWGVSAWSRGCLPGSRGESAWSYLLQRLEKVFFSYTFYFLYLTSFTVYNFFGFEYLRHWGLLYGIPACTEADTLPPCGQTHTCKNITLATTSLRPVRNTNTPVTICFYHVRSTHFFSGKSRNKRCHYYWIDCH